MRLVGFFAFCLLWATALAAQPTDRAGVDRLNAEALAAVDRDPVEAERLAVRARTAARGIRYTKGEAEAQRIYGVSFLWRNQLAVASRELTTAATMYERVGDQAGLSNVYRNLGTLAAEIDQLDQAIMWERRALEAAIRSGNSDSIARARTNLAASYGDSGLFAEAVAIYDDAMADFAKNPTGEDVQAMMLSNWANNAFRVNRFEEALRRFAEAEAILRQLDQPGIEISNSCNWAAALQRLRRYREALQKVSRCVALARKFGNPALLSDSLEDKAQIALDAGLIDDAIAYAREALAIAERERIDIKQREALIVLMLGFSEKGDFRAAFTYAEQLRTLEGRLLDDQRRREAQRALTQLDLERVRQRNQLLTQASQIQRLQLERNQSRVLLLLAGSLALMAALAAAIWAYVTKARSEKALAAKHDEVIAANTAVETANAQLRVALDDNQALLRELNHRVGNNLQVVLSMMNMQIRRIQKRKTPAPADTAKILIEVRERVQAMAQIHTDINLHPTDEEGGEAHFIEELTEQISRLHGNKAKIRLRLTPFSLSDERAAALALIVNEIVTNALEHAFPDGDDGGSADNLIAVNTIVSSGELVLTISDNGSGFKRERDPDSLGLSIITDLAAQLGGTVKPGQLRPKSKDRPGTLWTLKIPLDTHTRQEG